TIVQRAPRTRTSTEARARERATGSRPSTSTARVAGSGRLGLWPANSGSKLDHGQVRGGLASAQPPPIGAPSAAAAQAERGRRRPAAGPAASARSSCRAFERRQLFERLAGALRHTDQRRLDDMDGEAGFAPQALVDPVQQGAASDELEPPPADIRGELGRCLLE